MAVSRLPTYKCYGRKRPDRFEAEVRVTGMIAFAHIDLRRGRSRWTIPAADRPTDLGNARGGTPLMIWSSRPGIDRP